ncbi:hypothetical protein [Desulfosporosinus youngiae]|uniref:Uncharacterized protein n=1 Tax=Desulfosporosinus youngiae DSM 17734 TaxID=768710 RepID=H5Y588_9FIRM|nr:hypothetical protein [Desulfosporosinus youngiae]EHQ90192.1 hypothetical protein DesyoDRAFT_3158 [Desulfosporosinus youngiae DSM 17734]
MMNNVLDLRVQRKRHEAAYAVQEHDYSRYGFKRDFGKLKREDTEVILILLTGVYLST